MGTKNLPVSGTKNCYQTTDNYAHVILQDERIEGADLSCSGAWAVNITGEQTKGSWGEEGERVLPPQVNQLDEDTDLVSLSVGANDIGYNDLFDCFGAAMASGVPESSDCQTSHGAAITAGLTELSEDLDDVYAVIKAKAPNAQVVAAGYMPLMADGVTCKEVYAISQADRQWVMELTAALNQTVAGAATRHDAGFAMPANVHEHSGCQLPETDRWVDFTGANTGSYEMHPTAAGHRAMARAILAEADLA